MMKAHKIEIIDSIPASGARTYSSEADRVTLNGKDYIQLRASEAFIRDDGSWKGTKEEATIDAAERIEAMAASLLSQAQRLRESVAAKLEAVA